MPATPQTRAIDAANQAMIICQQLSGIYANILDYNRRIANNKPDALWSKFPTAAVNADGSLGTADASPVVTNPITIAGFTRAISSNSLTGLRQVIADLQTFIEGSGTVSQTDRRPLLDNLLGG